MVTKERNGLSFSEAGKIGFEKSRVKLVEQKKFRIDRYILKPNICNFCKIILSYEFRNNKFCGRSCSAKYYNQNRKIKIFCIECNKIILGDSSRKFCSKKCQQTCQSTKLVGRWKDGLEKGWCGNGFAVASYIRNYLFKKNNSKCEECRWNKINVTTNKIPLQIHHIDGDASNCKENNLKLLCPNCHSLTSTFGRLNKKTVRMHRLRHT